MGVCAKGPLRWEGYVVSVDFMQEAVAQLPRNIGSRKTRYHIPVLVVNGDSIQSPVP
jgi:hypothetical protein